MAALVTPRAITVLVAVGALLLATPSAAANDYYVDPVNGSNASSGLHPATPWKSLTFALAVVTDGPHTIHLAPGVYSAATGETFPIVPRRSNRIAGDQGKAVTLLDGGGASAVVSYFSDTISAPTSVPSDTELRGVTLRNAVYGLTIGSSWNPVAPTIRSIDITGMSVAGISFSTSGLMSGSVAPILEDVNVSTCAVGLHVGAAGLSSSAVFRRSGFENCTANGIEFSAFKTFVLTLDRCRVRGNGGDGVRVNAGNLGSVSVIANDSLFASNAARGLAASSAFMAGIGFNLTRCTVASNAGAGIDTSNPGGNAFSGATLASCIVYGNADDLLLGSLGSAHHCDIGDGDFNGVNGNFAADPKFVDAASGDFRLRWGSPCIGAGDPATPSGAVDLAGIHRPADGNLDTLPEPDCGAYEFAPLFVQGAANLGATISIELWGESSAASTVFVAPGGLVAPLATPFGALELDVLTAFALFTAAAAPAPPVGNLFLVPNNPFLVGQTFTLTALTSSTAMPFAAAFTNPFVLTVGP